MKTPPIRQQTAPSAQPCLKLFTKENASALAIVWDGENPAVPCGVCRQVLAEFCDPEMPVICANRKGEYKIFAMGDLLPDAFLPEDLKK